MTKIACLYCGQIEVEQKPGYLAVCKDCEDAYFDNCRDCVKGTCNIQGAHQALAATERRVGRERSAITHTARLVS